MAEVAGVRPPRGRLGRRSGGGGRSVRQPPLPKPPLAQAQAGGGKAR